MSSEAPSDAGVRRLNPFAFPSNTDFHFVLLIASVVSFSLSFYFVMSFKVGKENMPTLAEITRCLQAVEAAHPSPADIHAEARVFNQKNMCFSVLRRHEATWVLGGVALLGALAGALYWVLPTLKLRKNRLVPLPVEDAPEVAAYLAELCREAGLARPPSFVWNPLDPKKSALAFGRFRKYYVGLFGGLITQYYSDRAAFRAVLLHELAHLRNRDINKTYFTVAIWPAFVVAALVPEIASSRLDLRALLDERLLILASLVYLTRNALLRSREYYADVRASLWEGPTGALGRALQHLPQPAKGRWLRPFQLHPDAQDRQHTLSDTQTLFKMSYWESFAVGIAIALSFFPLQEILLSNIEPIGKGLLRSYLGASLVIAPLVVGVVGLGVWRVTFAALTKGETPRGAGRLGLAMGIGYFLGGGILKFNNLLSHNPTLLWFDMGWDALLLVSVFLFFRWIQAGASTWIEISATKRFMQQAYCTGLTLAGALLSIWLALLFFLRDIVQISHSTINSDLVSSLLLGSFSSLVLHPITWLFLISLWIFPLSAWFWRKRFVSHSAWDWVFLEPPPESWTMPPQPPLQLWRALKAGLIGVFLFCGLLFVIRIAVHLGVPEAIRATEEFRSVYYYSQCTLALFVQIIVAIIVVGRVDRLGALHGLLAAFVGGSGMAVGLLGLNLLFGGNIDLPFTWLVFSHVVNGGAILSLLIALAVVGIKSWRCPSKETPIIEFSTA